MRRSSATDGNVGPSRVASGDSRSIVGALAGTGCVWLKATTSGGGIADDSGYRGGG